MSIEEFYEAMYKLRNPDAIFLVLRQYRFLGLLEYGLVGLLH